MNVRTFTAIAEGEALKDFDREYPFCCTVCGRKRIGIVDTGKCVCGNNVWERK